MNRCDQYNEEISNLVNDKENLIEERRLNKNELEYYKISIEAFERVVKEKD